MARPIYVGGTSGGGTESSYSISLTALTGGVASAPIEGDLVIVATGWTQTSDGTPGVTSPTGFTELVELYSNDTRDANLSVSYKFMEMTPDSSITVLGPNSAAYGGSTVVHVWRGVDQTTPMDVTHTTATGTNASRPNPPSITPATADAIIIAAGLGTGGTGQSAFTIPSGMTNAVSYKHDGTTGDCSAFLCSYNSWVSGSYDPAAATGGTTTTQDSWVAVTLVLRPALALGDTLYFSADISSTSLCPGGLPILDDQGNVITDDTGDVIYDFDTVFITATSGLVANISASSVTSEVSYSLNNKLFVSIVGVSVVSTIDSAVERPLTSIISATSSASSPDATVVEGTYKYIAASIVAECLVPGGLPILDSNGEPILDDTGYVIYDFDTIFVTVDRSLTASISNISNTSTPEILSVQVRNLIAAVSSVSVSSDIGFSQIGRNLQADAQTTSVTSTLSNTLERNIVAGLQGISAVPDTVIEIVRSLIASIGSLSASSDASIEFLRDLVVSINATSSVRDISATVSGEVVLLADIHGDSTTSAADSTRQIDLLAVIGSSSSTSPVSEVSIGEARILVASIDLSSSTSVVATFVGRDLLSWVAAISVLGDAQLNADRKILAIINGTSITYDDVNLLLEGLGQIHNPRIYSATVRRGIVSRTTKRSIRSF